MSTQITMKVAIRKMGNSRGIIIPRPLLLQAGLEREAEMTIEKGSIVLRRPPSEPRIGWAAASLDVAATDVSAPQWTAFVNEMDAYIEW